MKKEHQQLKDEFQTQNQIVKDLGFVERNELQKEFQTLAKNKSEYHRFRFCQTLYLCLSTSFLASGSISTEVLQGDVTMKSNNKIKLFLGILGNFIQLVPSVGQYISVGVNFLYTVYEVKKEKDLTNKAKALSEVILKKFIVFFNDHINTFAGKIALEITKKIDSKYLDQYKIDPSQPIQQVSKTWIKKLLKKSKVHGKNPLDEYAMKVGKSLISYLCQNKENLLKELDGNGDLHKICVDFILKKEWEIK